jgi:hypothetical protein
LYILNIFNFCCTFLTYSLITNLNLIAIAGKASFNVYIGGDSWISYIGNLEIGLWFVSVVEDGNSPELETVNSAERKERRHATRVSNIVRYLQDKLNQFPDKDNFESGEFKLFEERLLQETQKLSVEPNGRELLSLLGEIYMSKAEIHLKRSFATTMVYGYNRFIDNFSFASGLAYGYLKAKKEPSRINEEEVINMLRILFNFLFS